MNIFRGNKLIQRLKYILKKIRRRVSVKQKIEVIGGKKNYIEQVYILNLDRQPKRWKHFVKEAESLKIDDGKRLIDFCTRLSAIDAKGDISTDKVKDTYSLNDQYYVDPDPRLLSIIRQQNIIVNMTNEEKAVALSHIKAWETIIREKRKYALILEDDVYFELNFPQKLNQIWSEIVIKSEELCSFDLLYLSFKEVNHGFEKTLLSNLINIPKRGLWWLSGYVLSYEGALKLINELPIHAPVDLWINLKFSKLKVFSSNQSLINQRVDIGSDNNYSILPILSQIGIQSDKTHLILEQRKGRNPVFVIGNGDKTATTIGIALSIIGYRCCINKWNEFSDLVEQIFNESKPLLFDAYVGFDFVRTKYKEIEKLYPNAVFIQIIEKNDEDKHRSIGNTEYKKIFIKDFANRKENLLIIQDLNSKTWKRLSKFLKCDFSKFDFADNDLSELNANNKVKLSHNEIPIKELPKNILQHDVHPWVIPYSNMESYGVIKHTREKAARVGYFIEQKNDNFFKLDDSYWQILENTFPSNLAIFSKENYHLNENGGISLSVTNSNKSTKKYSSSSIVTKEEYLFGKFEVEIKPIKTEGVVTAFFLHRNDPWQEIDFEFLGNNTSILLTNIYYNPGLKETNNNYGNRGTPITLQLNFDASKEFHKYAIEWYPHEVRWLVDNEIVHIRKNWTPTPIPDMPMRFYLNTWPTISKQLAGDINLAQLPKSAEIKCVTVKTLAFNEN